MNERHKKTLREIFSIPTVATLLFNEVVSLIKGLGGKVTCKDGSHHRIKLKERLMILPRPHGKTLPKYLVKRVRDFLESIGIKPDSS